MNHTASRFQLSRSRLWMGVLAAFILAVWVAAPARAAEESKDPAEETIGTVFRWLNFALVFGGLGYLIVRKGGPFFRARAAAVASGITEAAAAKREAERVLHEAESKLARLDTEVAALRAEAQTESAAEMDRIRMLAREEAEKIARAALAETEAGARAARMELRGIAARLAVERAEVLLRQRLDAPAEATLFQAFVQSLPGRAN